MRTFKDKHGRDWSVSLDIPTLERVSKLEGIDRNMVLNDPPTFMKKLLGDEFVLADVLHSACLEECQKQNLTAAQFAAVFDGKSIEAACDVFLEEYVDFFRDPVKRRGLKRVLEKTRTLQAKAMEMIDAKMADPATDAALEQQMQTLGSQFTDSLERSASAQEA